MKQTKTDELSKQGLTRDDREVMAKKGFTAEDIKGAVLDDPMGAPGHPGESLIGTSGVIVFCVLLFASGVFTVVLTSLTVIGIVVGTLMMLAAVIIPFFAFGRST